MCWDAVKIQKKSEYNITYETIYSDTMDYQFIGKYYHRSDDYLKLILSNKEKSNFMMKLDTLDIYVYNGNFYLVPRSWRDNYNRFGLKGM